MSPQMIQMVRLPSIGRLSLGSYVSGGGSSSPFDETNYKFVLKKSLV